MARDFEVLSVIIAEDVREETRGKTSILGMFDEDILVGSFPAILPKLSFRIALRFPEKKIPKKIWLAVLGIDGTRYFEYSGPLPNTSQNKLSMPVAIVFHVVPVYVPASGEIDVRLGIGDAKPRIIKRFKVRNPENPVEKGRITP